MMPGTGSDPAYRRIDVDTATGAVTGMIFKAVIPALEKQKNHFFKKKEE